MNDLFYQVAGHSFRLSFSIKILGGDRLINYTPFLVTEVTGECLFHLTIVDDLPMDLAYAQVGRFDDDIASIGVFKSKEKGFCFQIAYPGSKEYCLMETDAFFHKAKARLHGDPRHVFFCLNNCLMLLYAFSTAKLDTLLLHASVIKNNGEGFMFLGKSGTGKSTHSRLWFEHIEDSELLNDDNPVVRIIDDKTMVFGSPWSGKTPCYRNESVSLKGIAKLRQAPENKMTKLSALQAYAAILPACSSIRWENEMMTGVHRTVEKLATNIDCYLLDCLPDKEAAELSYTTINGIE